MTVTEIVGLLFTAFGLGYAGGSVIRIARKAIESAE